VRERGFRCMLLRRRGRHNAGLLGRFSEGRARERMDILLAPPGCSGANSVRS
jgi:hypothetical protein